MPRPRPPYLHRYVTRHGKITWYVRKPGGKRVRIRAEYGTPGFDESYRRAFEGAESPMGPKKATAGSLAWLWERYRETSSWAVLAPATRRQRENIMRGVLKASGAAPYRRITQNAIAAGRDRRSATPNQARHFLNTMRGLFRWALGAEHIAVDPTEKVSSPPSKTGAGFPVWSEAEVDLYQERWPLGTRERVWLDVLLYTGLRRGDAVQLGRQHVRDGIATIRTEKSGGEVTVTIPLLPTLQTTLASGPCGELAFICGTTGKAFAKESFGNAFRDACRAAGISKSAHGLRKAGATRAAENGATVAELEAIFGWRGGGMAALYTRDADRARLSRCAMSKLERTDNVQSMCLPNQKVSTRARIKKK